MISRRLLRIKAMQVLYAYFQNTDKSIKKAEEELFFSIQKYYDLYHYLLLLLIDVANHAENKMDMAKQKRMPSYQDLHPNTRFIKNTIIAQLKDNNALNSYLNNQRMSWVNYPELIKELYSELINTEFYQEYMAEERTSYASDKQFLIDWYSLFLGQGQDYLLQILEEQSIYWNDDLEFALSMIVKTLKRFKPKDDAETKLMPLYKQAEDRDFARQLLSKTIYTGEETKALVKEHSKNWDVDRITYIDVLILQMALTEITSFPSIPLKVSFNEYIEIAKFYSTAKSNIFINGLLDKAVETLKAQDKIHKEGRGLVDM